MEISNSPFVHKAANDIASVLPTGIEPALIKTANETNDALTNFLKGLAVTIILLGLIWGAMKTKFAAAGVIGAIVVGAFLYWGVYGGFEWLGTQLGETLDKG